MLKIFSNVSLLTAPVEAHDNDDSLLSWTVFSTVRGDPAVSAAMNLLPSLR